MAPVSDCKRRAIQLLSREMTVDEIIAALGVSRTIVFEVRQAARTTRARIVAEYEVYRAQTDREAS